MTDWRTQFDELDAQASADVQRQQASAGLLASQRNPDQYARANALSDKTGMSPDLVHDNLPQFEQQDRDAGFQRLTDSHPELTGLASDPRWRTLAQDQAPQLSAFAEALKQAKRDRSPFATGTGTANDPLRVNKALGFGKSGDYADVWNRAPVGTWVQREDGSLVRRDASMWENVAGAVGRGVAEAKKSIASLPDVLSLDAISSSLQATEEAKARGDVYVNPYPSISTSGLAPAVPASSMVRTQDAAARAHATAGREIPGIATREADRNRQVQQVQDQTQGLRPASVQALDRAQTAGETLRAVAAHPIDTILSVGVESSVQFAPATVAGLLTRNPAVVAAAAGGTSGSLELTNGVSDYAQRAGVDTANAEAMRQFLTQGDNLKKALEYARTRGAIIGSVDALTGPIGKYLHFSERQIGHLATRELANIAGQTAMQAAAGAGGEAGAQYATTGQVNGKDVVLEAVGELASTPGEVSGFAYDRIRTARDHQALQAVTQAAAESKLGERSAPDLEAAARAVSGDQRVHLSAEAARTLFQNDPATLADMVGGQDALAEQMASGDLSIPLAKWATTVSRMPNAEEVNRHARLDPNGISVAEMERLDEEAAKFAGDTTDAAARATPATPDSRQQVVDDVMGQLVATDRYSPAQAEAQAKLWGAAFGQFAARSGQDAFGLYQRYMAGLRNGSNADVPAETLNQRQLTGTKNNPLTISAQHYLDNNIVSEKLDSQDFSVSVSPVFKVEGVGYVRVVTDGHHSLAAAQRAGANPEFNTQDASQNDTIALLSKGRQGIDDFLSLNMIDGSYYDINSGRSLFQPAIPKEVEIEQLRARVAELENELRTDRLTGMRNQRAFEEDESLGWSTVAAADMDGLKKLNDAIGHEHADKVLRALGAVLLASEGDGVRFYRRSGDEFAARFQDRGKADQVMREVQQKLENVAIDIDVTDAAGRIRSLTYNGIGLTYGTGHDYQSADTAANASKRERLRAGIRDKPRGRGKPRRLQPRARGEGGVGANQEPQRTAASRGLIARAADAVRSLFQSAPADQTKTPEFKRWFGDSKVVDENGSPLVVYHGTDSTPFEVFDRSKGGSGPSKFGFWFANQESFAELFGGNMIPVYLKVENPKRITLEKWNSIRDSHAKDGEWFNRWRDELIAQGHDGLIVSGGTEQVGRFTVQNPDVLAVFDPTQVKSAAANRGTFDPNDPSILNQQNNASGPRGQINIFPDRRMSIQLFENADRSTFLHESAHFFFEVMRDLATDENPEIKADFDALLGWFGAENADALTTDHLEQFARGFESYVGEGKAPSPELQGIFAKFSAWILGVYRSLKALNVNLTDDVRSVFDRMLASDDEIEAAKVRQGMRPIARDASEAKALGLTDRQWADYLAEVEAATEEARKDVFNKTVGALQREQRKWWKEERTKVREEVAAKYEATPAVRALNILNGRKVVDGVELAEPLAGLKLDREAIVANWGEAYLKRLGKTYAKSGGVHPDEAAAMLGYTSGDDLLRALANAPDTLARVDAETDAIMRERHGDPMTDGSLPEKAMDAVHGSKRVKLLERELALLSDLAGEPAPSPRIMRAIAERQIAGKTPRQLRPNDYLVAERRAAREALQAAAKRDFGAALKAKRQQALNVSLYSVAREAQDQFERDLNYLRRVSSNDRRARLGKAGHDYLEQVDALLEAVELKQVSGPDVQRRQRLAEWVKRQEDAGNPVDIPAKLLADSGLTNIRDMTHTDIRGVVDTIKQIEHLAKTKTLLWLAGQERDREAVDAEMAASIRAAHAAVPERTGDPTKRERFSAAIADLDVGRVLPTNVARELDGYEDGGAVWANVIQPIRTAMYERVIPAMHKMQDEVAAIYAKHYTKEELRRLDSPVWRESVKDHWSKGRILSLAMNWGSDGNREAILTQAKSRLTEAQAVELLRTLDARDFAFVQDIVDKVNAYWLEIAETQRRRTGLMPEKVDGMSYTIEAASGEMVHVRGGYFPLKYDAERSGYGTTLNEIDDIYNSLRVGRTAKAATRNGHTIERVGSGGKTVSLGLDIATSHMRDVIRDLYLGDAVAYVHNVLHGSQFADAAISTGKRSHLKALELWLKDVAAGEMGARSTTEKVLRFARLNTTAAVLTYKPAAAALQVSGIIQTGSIIGNRNALHGVRLLLSKWWFGPNSIWNEIREKSAFMRERFGQIPEAVEMVQSQRAGALKATHASMIRWGYVPMARFQMIADAATWLAGERLGLKKFDGDIEKARAFADDLVVRAQSPEGFFDKSSISRGTLDEKHRQSELVKTSTMLLSYMIAKGNVAREKYQATSFTSPMQVAKFTVDMVQLFAIEAMISGLARGGLPKDADDDDSVLDDWIAYITKETAFGSLATIPLVSQLATEGRGYTAQGVMDRGWATLSDATAAWFDGNLDRKDLKQAVNVSGVAAGIPSSQINTTADALWRVHDGEDVSPLDFAVRQEKKN